MPELTDEEIDARIRAARRCALHPACREERRPGGTLCWDDHDELGRVLDPAYAGERDLDRAASIPQLFARLDPTPATAGDQGRRAPGFASQPPLDLHSVAMRDERSVGYPVVDVWYDPHPRGYGDDLDSPHHEDEAPPRAVRKAITGIAETVFDDLRPGCSFDRVVDLTRLADDPHGVRDVEGWCRWLHAHLDHITARDDAADIYRDLVELHDQLRPAAGDPKPRPVAHCTGWVRDRQTGEKVDCGAPLFMPPPQPGVEHGVARPPKLDPNRPVMRCHRCDRPYTYLQLLRAEIGEQRAAS